MLSSDNQNAVPMVNCRRFVLLLALYS